MINPAASNQQRREETLSGESSDLCSASFIQSGDHKRGSFRRSKMSANKCPNSTAVAVISTTPNNSGTSRLCTAVTLSSPNPGQPRTFSTTTDPLITPPSEYPNTVTSG